MSDMSSTWSLDWSGFKRGVDGVNAYARKGAAEVDSHERSTRKASKAMGMMDASSLQAQKGIMGMSKALAGVGAAGLLIKFAHDSILEYKRSIGTAGDETDRMTQSVQRLQASLGRDLAQAWDSVSSSLATSIDKLAEYRERFADYVGEGYREIGQRVGLSPDGAYETARDVSRFQAMDDAAARRGSVLNAFASHQGEVYGAERAAQGDPLAELEAEQIKRRYRHRDRLLELSKSTDPIKREADTLAENRLFAAESADISRKVAAKKQELALADELLKLDREAAQADGLRLQNREAEAVYLEKDVAMRKEIAKINADPTLSPLLRMERRLNASSVLSYQRDMATEVAKKRAAESHDASVLGIRDALEQARIQRVALEGRQTAAELASIQLEYEQKIRGVLIDQSLSIAEQADGARRFASARDELLRATAEADILRDTDAYQATLRGRTYRTLESGVGPEAARGVFGPNPGLIAGTSSQPNAELVKKLDTLNKTLDAAQQVLQRIERNTKTPVAIAG